MIKIYRKSHLCASIKVADDGTYQVSARKVNRESSDPCLLEKTFRSWTAATRFLEEIASDW